MQPILNEEYLNEIEYAREELEDAIKNKSCAPIGMLRLAYASQFAIAKAHRDRDQDAQKLKSSDQNAGSSQPNTQIEPLSVAYNHDLQNAVEICGKIKTNHPKITSPDLYQLAGVVAVKELGGPAIGFIPGRKDSSIPPDEGCVPYGRKGQSELREIFHPMGFDDKDIVALCGGLKLARANAGVEGSPKAKANAGVEGSPKAIANASVEGSSKAIAVAGVKESPKVGANAGVEGTHPAQTNEPFKFVNSYFKEVLNRSSSNEIDKALFDDEEFRKCVEIYAKDSQDQKAFFADYKKSHKKLSEFKPHSWIEDHIPMAQRAVGVAVAAAVAILSFFYLFKRRRASKHSSQHPQ